MFDNKLMSGKKGLVMELLMTDQFLGQLQKAYEYGAELAFTYQGDALGKRVILSESQSDQILFCLVKSQKPLQ